MSDERAKAISQLAILGTREKLFHGPCTTHKKTNHALAAVESVGGQLLGGHGRIIGVTI